MIAKKNALAAGAVALLALTGGGVAYAAASSTTATCTANPIITAGATDQSFDVHCSVPNVSVASTVTTTSTVTAPPQTVTVTVSPTSTTSTTAAPVPPTSSTTTAAAAGLNCGPNPSKCGYPDATNTGLSGPVTPGPCPTNGNVDNAVIQNLDLVNCSFTITGKNVTVKNVRMRITATDRWALGIQGSGYAKISNVDIAGKDAGSGSVQYAIFEMGSGPTTIDKANLSNCMDCIVGEGTVVTNSYIHDMAHITGAHDDGLMCNAECGITYRHNTVYNKWTSTAAIALFADFGTPSNSVVDDNLIAGGGYMAYLGGSNATGIKFTNNRFSRHLYPAGTNGGPGGGYWGTSTEWSPANSGNAWTGNVWDDTGAVAK